MTSSGEIKHSPGQRVFKSWFPLGGSWFLLALEGPLMYAVVGRFPSPELGLAAFGGLVLPITYLIESPILSLLSASTALCKNTQAYQLLRGFAYSLSFFLSLLQLAMALSPIYGLVVFDLIGAPAAVGELARQGILILSPVPWLVGYRRFNQGLLIRFGKSGVIGVGTVLRLLTLLSSGGLGYYYGAANGVILAASALVFSVFIEAVYVGYKVRPIVNGPLGQAPESDVPLTLGRITTFYLPLALTVILYLATLPMYSAAICRMPELLLSLAAWPLISSLGFVFRSMGLGLIEVTIAYADQEEMRKAIARFTYWLAGICSLSLLVVAVTPLAEFYFVTFSGLDPTGLKLAIVATLLTVLTPAAGIIQCYYEGLLIHAHRTRVITLSVVIHLLSSIAVLASGIYSGSLNGAYVAGSAVFAGYLIQTLWLRSMTSLADS